MLINKVHLLTTLVKYFLKMSLNWDYAQYLTNKTWCFMIIAMTYYKQYPEEIIPMFWDEPLPESLMDDSFNEYGELDFSCRAMLLIELIAISEAEIGGKLPQSIFDRLLSNWTTDAGDILEMGEQLAAVEQLFDEVKREMDGLE